MYNAYRKATRKWNDIRHLSTRNSHGIKCYVCSDINKNNKTKGN